MCPIKRRTAKVSYFSIFLKLFMLSQSLWNPVDQLKTPLNPVGFRLTLAPNVSRPIIPWRQATTLRCGLLEGIRWAGCVQAPCRWITRTTLHRWIMERSTRGDSVGCARLLAHHWLREKRSLLGPKGNQALVGPSNCVVFLWTCWLCFLWTSWLCFFASFEITQQLTLRRKFSSFCSIQM